MIGRGGRRSTPRTRPEPLQSPLRAPYVALAITKIHCACTMSWHFSVCPMSWHLRVRYCTLRTPEQPPH